VSSLLEVRNLCKSFGGFAAVSNVGFAVERGAIVALVGPNGAGKSTTFNIIAGALPPDSGGVIFEGSRIDRLRPDQLCRVGIGRTFQIVKPFSGLTVLDNVIVGALKQFKRLAEARRHAASILEMLGLDAKRDLPAAALTFAEAKRLEVARALATQPKLLLLDESMAGLRPSECDEMVGLIREINSRQGITIIIIEHIMRAVVTLAQKVVVLNHGRVIAIGTPEAVARDPAVLACYLGEAAEL